MKRWALPLALLLLVSACDTGTEDSTTTTSTTTSTRKTAVCFGPMMLRMTRMLGRETAGPASSRVRAGPRPMPAPSRPSRI